MFYFCALLRNFRILLPIFITRKRSAKIESRETRTNARVRLWSEAKYELVTENRRFKLQAWVKNLLSLFIRKNQL